MLKREIRINAKGVELDGELEVPAGASGLVLFAHGSGSSRHSPRNQYVARVLREAGVGTLLFDLLTREEEQAEVRTRHFRFDIPLLAERLMDATAWAREGHASRGLKIGYFGSSTGAAAALVAAAAPAKGINAVVSRGGRPDLAGDVLEQVAAPTLLIVGGDDVPVIGMNQEAYDRLQCQKDLRIVPGASHLFEEPGTLEVVATMASRWFVDHLQAKVERRR
jgi:dienelactone hydrolase